jgi:hypothetical protein
MQKVSSDVKCGRTEILRHCYNTPEENEGKTDKIIKDRTTSVVTNNFSIGPFLIRFVIIDGDNGP